MRQFAVGAAPRRRFLKVCCAAALSGYAAVARAGQAASRAALDFALPDLQGKTVQLSSLRGKVVVIDFWASWCEPCLKELPRLEALHRKLSPQGVIFLAINLDQERNNALALVSQLKLSLPVLLDPQGKVAASYDPPKMPSSYVLDKAGVVRYLNAGFDGDKDIARLERQLAELTKH